MSAFVTPRKKIDAGIDMTPLIDVVFQLLIFLMVSSQFVKPDREVELPAGAESAEEVPLTEEKKSHMVTITAENELILNSEEISVEQFAEKMKETLENSEIKRLEIRGDTASNLGTFIEILETAKLIGVESVSYHKKPSTDDE